MANILLIEPNYPAKYPPLGLMKLAFYHKYMKKDKLIVFAKGFFKDDAYKQIIWDRIYISTLFTFEWDETIKAIEYAKRLSWVGNSKIIVGGSMATLMPDEIEKETGIKPVKGLLNESYKLGFKDDYVIDNLPPDYSILQQTGYKYPYENNYFAFTTRGCGMNCSFCAVKKLEPKYIDYISIKDQITTVRKMDQSDNKPGELRKDLLLLDNNVLKSKYLSDIVNDLEDLGFTKGATFINQLSGKINKRYVDFNQGLDANFLTVEKAKILSRLALKPVRIAFDHIEDRYIYENAIMNCYKHGMTEFSNYILYNTDQTIGKGHKYDADKPEDLYNRLKITMELKENINTNCNNKSAIKIYSFPMKYIPLNNKSRDYIGSNWNKKYLRAIQIMLTPTQGKGVSGKGFFEAAFGKNVEEFKLFLLMPEDILASRGVIKKQGNSKENTEKERLKSMQNLIRNEWINLLNKLNCEDDLLEIIKDNCFATDKFFLIENQNLRLIYLYYLSPTQFFNLLSMVKKDEDKQLIYNYCKNEAPYYLSLILEQAILANYSYKLLDGFARVFGNYGVQKLIEIWINRGCVEKTFVNNLHNLYISSGIYKSIDPRILKILKHYVDLNIFTYDDICDIKEYIWGMDTNSLQLLIYNKLPLFKEKLKTLYLTNSVGLNILEARLNETIYNIESTLLEVGGKQS